MASKNTQGLPSPPTEECHPVSGSRRSLKAGKTSNRTSKKASSQSSHDSGRMVLDGRHKRVWKACERCRMKKTKCDGESPCKLCKDDGLVCTAGSRKKTEFKQLPRGYAEVLENTQYALIATVQKLYTMVRNGESWDLGEPELNDRGLPVIHNIAEKLGCIRPSPDMPQAFPEDAEDFTELQSQLTSGKLLDSSERTQSEDGMSHPDRTDRASSSESDHSELSKDYKQILWSQQQAQQLQGYSLSQFQGLPGSQFDEDSFQIDYKQEPLSSTSDSTLETTSIASPIFSEFQSQSQICSPVFRPDSPFSPWSASGDELFTQPHLLDLTAIYMQQQQQQFKQPPSVGMPRSVPVRSELSPNSFNMRANAFMASNDGTVRPNMLDCRNCNGGLNLADQVDNIMFGDYETMTMG